MGRIKRQPCRMTPVISTHHVTNFVGNQQCEKKSYNSIESDSVNMTIHCNPLTVGTSVEPHHSKKRKRSNSQKKTENKQMTGLLKSAEELLKYISESRSSNENDYASRDEQISTPLVLFQNIVIQNWWTIKAPEDICCIYNDSETYDQEIIMSQNQMCLLLSLFKRHAYCIKTIHPTLRDTDIVCWLYPTSKCLLLLPEFIIIKLRLNDCKPTCQSSLFYDSIHTMITHGLWNCDVTLDSQELDYSYTQSAVVNFDDNGLLKKRETLLNRTRVLHSNVLKCKIVLGFSVFLTNVLLSRTDHVSITQLSYPKQCVLATDVIPTDHSITDTSNVLEDLRSWVNDIFTRNKKTMRLFFIWWEPQLFRIPKTMKDSGIYLTPDFFFNIVTCISKCVYPELHTNNVIDLSNVLYQDDQFYETPFASPRLRYKPTTYQLKAIRFALWRECYCLVQHKTFDNTLSAQLNRTELNNNDTYTSSIINNNNIKTLYPNISPLVPFSRCVWVPPRYLSSGFWVDLLNDQIFLKQPIEPNFSVKGGFLCDEMGLGKTLELLGLIILHPAPDIFLFYPYKDVYQRIHKHITLTEPPLLPQFFKKNTQASHQCLQDTLKPFQRCFCGTLILKKDEKTIKCCEICNGWFHSQCIGIELGHDPFFKSDYGTSCPISESNSIIQDEMDITSQSHLFVCPICFAHYFPVLPVRATLVIVPNSILSQWDIEIKKHTQHPPCSVIIYPGIHTSSQTIIEKKKCNRQIILSHPINFKNVDIVLCSYETLRSEFHFIFQKQRHLRFPKKHRPCPTPLLSIKWWRIVLDESQMVDGHSHAALMASKLMSEFRWCVTGTPIIRDLGSDLPGLLATLGPVGLSVATDDYKALKDCIQTLMIELPTIDNLDDTEMSVFNQLHSFIQTSKTSTTSRDTSNDLHLQHVTQHDLSTQSLINHFCEILKPWERLGHICIQIAKLLSPLLWRTLSCNVQEELTIPIIHYHTISLRFTSLERYMYQRQQDKLQKLLLSSNHYKIPHDMNNPFIMSEIQLDADTTVSCAIEQMVLGLRQVCIHSDLGRHGLKGSKLFRKKLKELSHYWNEPSYLSTTLHYPHHPFQHFKQDMTTQSDHSKESDDSFELQPSNTQLTDNTFLLNRHVSSKNVLSILMNETRILSEEHLRGLCAALNGLAGLAILQENYMKATTYYRIVLSQQPFFDMTVNKEIIRVDPFQLLHASFNLNYAIRQMTDEQRLTIDPLIDLSQLDQSIKTLTYRYMCPTRRIVEKIYNKIIQLQSQDMSFIIKWESHIESLVPVSIQKQLFARWGVTLYLMKSFMYAYSVTMLFMEEQTNSLYFKDMIKSTPSYLNDHVFIKNVSFLKYMITQQTNTIEDVQEINHLFMLYKSGNVCRLGSSFKQLLLSLESQWKQLLSTRDWILNIITLFNHFMLNNLQDNSIDTTDQFNLLFWDAFRTCQLCMDKNKKMNHLSQDELNPSESYCLHCILFILIKQYELCFYKYTGETDYQLHKQESDLMFILRILAIENRKLHTLDYKIQSNDETILSQNASLSSRMEHIEKMNYLLQKEVSLMLKFRTASYQLILSLDELRMSKERFRLIPDTEKNGLVDTPCKTHQDNNNLVELNMILYCDIPILQKQFEADHAIAQEKLQRTKARFRFLLSLSQSSRYMSQNSIHTDSHHFHQPLQPAPSIPSHIDNTSKNELTNETDNKDDLCPICLEQLYNENCNLYEEDRQLGGIAFLRCAHSLCISCFRHLMSQSQNHSIVCPTCRQSCCTHDVLFVNPEEDTSQTYNEKAQADILSKQSTMIVLGSCSVKLEAVFKRIQWILNSPPTTCDTVFKKNSLKHNKNIPDKIIVFTEWNEAAFIVLTLLTVNGITALLYRGIKADANNLKRFCNEKTCRVLICNLKKAGLGLTLTVANHIIFLEPCLNIADENQAIGRIRRIGQSKQQFVWRFIIENTIEEGIVRRKAAQDHLTTNLFNVPKCKQQGLTLSDIKLLFGPSMQSGGNV